MANGKPQDPVPVPRSSQDRTVNPDLQREDAGTPASGNEGTRAAATDEAAKGKSRNQDDRGEGA